MNLSIRHKIFLVAALPTIALMGFAGYAVKQTLDLMRRADDIKMFAEFSRSALFAADALESESAFASGVAGSRGNFFSADFKVAITATDTAIATFRQLLSMDAETTIGRQLSATTTELQGLQLLRSNAETAQVSISDLRHNYEKRIGSLVEVIRVGSQVAAQEPSLFKPFLMLLNRVEHKRRISAARSVIVGALVSHTISGSELKEYYELRSEEGVFEREALSGSDTLALDDAARANFTELAMRKHDFDQFAEEIIAVSDADSINISAARWLEVSASYIHPLAKSEKFLSDVVIRQAVSVQESSKVALRSVLLFSFCTLLLLTVVSVFIIRSITQPLTVLVEHASNVSKGNFTSIEHINSENEIGRLAATFNEMTTHIHSTLNDLQESKIEAEQSRNDALLAQRQVQKHFSDLRIHIEQILAAMERFATGDLSATVLIPSTNIASTNNLSIVHDSSLQDTSSIERLFRGYNQSLAGIRAVMRRMDDAIRGAAQVGDEILQQTEGLAQGTNHQTEQSLEIASAIEELSKTIAENTRQISIAAEEANEAGAEARSGGAVITSTIQSMSDIGNMVVTLASTIERLGESSNHISDVIELIYGIADQTNLLALNAAIEAARAGDAGRGFAVVADEVRKLAERTQSATKEIGQMVERIRTDTTQAVMIARSGAHEAARSADAAAESSSALERIIERTTTVSDIIAGLSAAGEQQTEVAEDIARRTSSISIITKSSSEAAHHIAATVHEMDALMINVQELVQGFVLVENSGNQ